MHRTPVSLECFSKAIRKCRCSLNCGLQPPICVGNKENACVFYECVVEFYVDDMTGCKGIYYDNLMFRVLSHECLAVDYSKHIINMK